MADRVIFGMSFPYIFQAMILAWLAYKLMLSALKHSPFWAGAWHKPLLSFSLYLIGLSVIYYVDAP